VGRCHARRVTRRRPEDSSTPALQGDARIRTAVWRKAARFAAWVAVLRAAPREARSAGLPEESAARLLQVADDHLSETPQVSLREISGLMLLAQRRSRSGGRRSRTFGRANSDLRVCRNGATSCHRAKRREPAKLVERRVTVGGRCGEARMGKADHGARARASLRPWLRLRR